MHAQIQWTSFRFSAPESIPEELYSGARCSPAEFRREFVNRHLLGGLKQTGRAVVPHWGIAAILVGMASLFDCSNRNSWSYTWGTLFGTVGAILAVSGILTAGSFIRYALTYRTYWVGVQSVAIVSESYSDFLRVVRERRLLKNSALQTSRPLNFNKASIIIAVAVAGAVFLVAINAKTPRGADGSRIFFALFCGLLIGFPTYLLANFYSNKWT